MPSTKNEKPTQNREAVNFFNKASTSFTSAASKSSIVEHDLQIQNYRIRLKFADPKMVPHLTPALGHLTSKFDKNPDLTVHLWSGTTIENNLEFLPQHPPSNNGTAETYRFSTESINGVFNFGPPTTFSLLNKESNEALYFISSAEEIPYYDSGSPLRAILYWWFIERGLLIAHAGAVGTNDGVVLLVGQGGSGKTNSTLACLKSDLLYAGDDYVLIDPKHSGAVGLYSSAKLDPKDLERFPYLRPAVSNPHALDTEKAVLFLHKLYPEKIGTSFPIKAVLLPVITPQPKTQIKKITPSQALLSLAPSTILQLPGAGKKDFQIMADLVTRTPCYILEVGQEISEIPKIILKMLK